MASIFEKIAKYVDKSRLESALGSYIEKVGIKKAFTDIKPLLKSMKDSFKKNIDRPTNDFREELENKFGIETQDANQIINSVRETLLARKLKDLDALTNAALAKMEKLEKKRVGPDADAVKKRVGPDPDAVRKKVAGVIEMMRFNRYSYLTDKVNFGKDIKSGDRIKKTYVGDSLDDRINTYARQLKQLLIIGYLPVPEKESLPLLQTFIKTELQIDTNQHRPNHARTKSASTKTDNPREDYREPVFHDEPIKAPTFHEEPKSPSNDLDGLDKVVDTHAKHYAETIKADTGRVTSALSNKNDVGLKANQTQQNEAKQDTRSTIKLKH
jgi:hypothetical protein